MLAIGQFRYFEEPGNRVLDALVSALVITHVVVKFSADVAKHV